jgi:hypothetical protein
MLKSDYLRVSHKMRWHQHNYFADPTWDPFLDQYRSHLLELDRIVQDTGSNLEGNVMYLHNDPTYGTPDPRFLHKRRFLAMAAQTSKHTLEIGFNAGHSALIMLTANPDLKLTAVDIGWHPYTIPCFNYLQSHFGDRIRFIHSDSLQAWPMLVGESFDFVHIDGNHEPTHLEVDLINVLTYTERGTRVLVDDINVPYLKSVVDLWRLQGWITPQGDPGPDQGFYLNNRP